MIDWIQLVKERDEWVARNFPGDNDGVESTLGCIEELGELTHGFLKKQQGIRGTPAEHDAKMKDAIGDLVIYLLGVMSANCRASHIVPAETREHRAIDSIFGIARQNGALSTYYYQHELDGMTSGAPIWEFAVNRILGHCLRFCEFQGWDFEAIVTDTWAHVKQRDWNKHRAEGAASDDPAMADPEITETPEWQLAQATSILNGHPGLQPWEPPILAGAILVAAGVLQKSDLDG